MTASWADLFERAESYDVDRETLRSTAEELRAEATDG